MARMLSTLSFLQRKLYAYVAPDGPVKRLHDVITGRSVQFERYGQVSKAIGLSDEAKGIFDDPLVQSVICARIKIGKTHVCTPFGLLTAWGQVFGQYGMWILASEKRHSSSTLLTNLVNAAEPATVKGPSNNPSESGTWFKTSNFAEQLCAGGL
ncbi:hypothetical protein IW262DRAFT_1451159 [Armillaria fumosa]|nr:hypothetical protein IW262DRAFT_1451159 [Armillaria fumosa]